MGQKAGFCGKGEKDGRGAKQGGGRGVGPMAQEEGSARVKGKQFLLRDEKESVNAGENLGYTAMKMSTLGLCVIHQWRLHRT